MSRTYNVIDADGHILEPFNLWNDYLDPAFRDRAPRLVKDNHGKQRLLLEEQAAGQPRGLRRHRRRRRAPGRGRRRGHGLRGRPQGRLRPACAHPRHGSRRHRRRLPLSQPRPVRRRDQRSRASPARCAAPTTAGSPTTASPTPTGCSASPCCRCSRSRRRSRRCASPARSSASAAASCGPTPTTTASCTTPDYEPFWTAAEELDFAIGLHEGGNSGMPTVGVDRFDGRGAQHIISHTMEMMLAAMSMIWGGVCERHPKLRVALPRIGRRLDRAVARPHGPPLRRQGLQRFRPAMRPSDLFRRNCWISFEPVEGSHRRAGRLYRPAQDPVGDRLSAPRRLLPRRARR